MSRIAIAVAMLAGVAHAEPAEVSRADADRWFGELYKLADVIAADRDRCDHLTLDFRRIPIATGDALDRTRAAAQAGKALPVATIDRIADCAQRMIAAASRPACRTRLGAKPIEVLAGALASIELPERAAADPRMVALDAQLIDALDADDDVRVRIEFIEGKLLYRDHRLADAATFLLDIVDYHREHETAEYAVDLVFDIDNQLHKYDEIGALAERLGEDRQFLANKPQLAELVATIRRQVARKQVEQLERDGRFVVCGQRYLDLYAVDPKARDGDELLYNAAVCFEQGKSLDAARRAVDALQEAFPKSPLAAKAVARLHAAQAN